MTADLKQAAQIALLALEYHTQQTRPIVQTEHAIKALMEALAAPSPAEGDGRAAFEAWAESHGGLSLVRVSSGERGAHELWPCTYYQRETEIAWRAWANKPQPKGTACSRSHPHEDMNAECQALTVKARADNAAAQAPAPIDMVLHCPACGLQHIDAPDERTEGWKNEPHRSHLCHGCGHIWRPADVPTNGVKAVQTKGKADSPIQSPAPAPEVPEGFALVPVKPTDAMALAACKVMLGSPQINGLNVWAAMIAAAPAAPCAAVAHGKPVAWGLFAKVEDGTWHLQHPVRFTEEDAKADRAMYERTTMLDIRPLYDLSDVPVHHTGEQP